MDSPSDHISEQLQQARECAGLSIDDVSFKTRIPKSVLRALEAGDFEVFCSPTYARSFLSQYSEYLGVDAGPWIEALQPGTLMADSMVHPWLDQPRLAERKPEIRMPAQSASPAWLSAACVILLSGGILFAAARGYDYLETRYGAEVYAPAPAGASHRHENPAATADSLQAAVTASNVEEETGPTLEPAPRPRIVHE